MFGKKKNLAPDLDMTPSGFDLAIRGVTDNLVTTGDSIEAWYVLNPVWWEFLSNQQRSSIIAAQARAWVSIVGREWHLRVTTRPFPAAAWARNLDLLTPNPVDQDAWAAYLRDRQEAMRGQSLGESAAFLGVQIGNRGLMQEILAKMPRRRAQGKADLAARERRRIDNDLTNVTRALDEIARPATQREVEWLVQRSIGLCLPNPAAYRTVGDRPIDSNDLAGVYDAVDIDRGGLGSRHLEIIGSEGRSGPGAIRRSVAVMSVGRVEVQDIPKARRPWLSHALRFGGVEMSVRGRILSGREAAADVEKRLQTILDQKPQYVQHDMSVPPSLDRAHTQAIRRQDQMIEGAAVDAEAAHVWVRIAIPGTDARNVMDRAEQMRKAFDRNGIELHFMRNQEGAYREFIPGEPKSTTAHHRRMPAEMWAASVPHLSTSLGDKQGQHVGRVAGSSGAQFVWDLHRAMINDDRGGYTPVAGDMGSGKSYFCGGLMAVDTLRGICGTILDPSGPLAKIAEWGPIRDVTRVISLLDGDPGLLSPFAMIPEPTQREAEEAKKPIEDLRKMASLRRGTLALDVFRACLPPGLGEDQRTEVLLSEAIRATGNRVTTSMIDALNYLKGAEGDDPHARAVYQHLMGMSDHPYTRLMFHTQQFSDAVPSVEPTLLIITLAGLVLPNFDLPRTSWDIEERLAVPLVNVAAHYSARRIYSRPRDEPKTMFLDEAHFLEGWPSGRALLSKLQRDSRKHRVRVFSASQDVATTLSAQKAAKALAGDVLIGAMNDFENQQAGLMLARAPIGAGYEKKIAGLRPAPQPDGMRTKANQWREWIVRVDDRVGQIRPDFSGIDGGALHRLLLTTPEEKASIKGLNDLVDGEWFQ